MLRLIDWSLSMTTTLADDTFRQEASLDARGTSGSTLKATSVALGLLLLAYQANPAVAGEPARYAFPGQTAGTGTEIVSLRITENDLLSQLARVYQTLSREQVDLDADATRVLYENLWSLY
jgi:hypothetical protein